jgi:hypothetical protein
MVIHPINQLIAFGIRTKKKKLSTCQGVWTRYCSYQCSLQVHNGELNTHQHQELWSPYEFQVTDTTNKFLWCLPCKYFHEDCCASINQVLNGKTSPLAVIICISKAKVLPWQHDHGLCSFDWKEHPHKAKLRLP